MLNKGMSCFLSELYFSYGTRKLRIETLLSFRSFLVSKKRMDKKVWVVSRFSVRNFLWHIAENVRRGNL